MFCLPPNTVTLALTSIDTLTHKMLYKHKRTSKRTGNPESYTQLHPNILITREAKEDQCSAVTVQGGDETYSSEKCAVLNQ